MNFAGNSTKSLIVCIRDRIEPGFTGSSSVRFGFVFLNPIRVRFGSASFFENQFGFGSVRLHFWRTSSGSVRFDCISKNPVRVRFGSIRTEPNRYNSTRFGSFSISAR